MSESDREQNVSGHTDRVARTTYEGSVAGKIPTFAPSIGRTHRACQAIQRGVGGDEDTTTNLEENELAAHKWLVRFILHSL